jgi:hypothetical protein
MAIELKGTVNGLKARIWTGITPDLTNRPTRMPEWAKNDILKPVNKCLTLLLILAMTLQPAQPLLAGGCNMPVEQSGHGDHMATNIEGGHAGMQHGSETENLPDCCDAGPGNQQNTCDPSMSCAVCVVGTMAVPELPATLAYWHNSQLQTLSPSALPPSHTYPLLRPPIS